MQDVVSLIESVAQLVIANKLSEARDVLGALNSEDILAERRALLSRLWPKDQQRTARPSIRRKRKDPSLSLALQIFRRDHFTCRYAHCQRRTIYAPVLIQLSRLFPIELPYHKHWKLDSCHVLFWVYTTSIEHKLSFPHGGDSAEANLITACYCCNDAKNYLHLDDLGWQITDPSGSNWDGLESTLPALSLVGIDHPFAPISKRGSPSSTQKTPRRLGVSIAPEFIKPGSLIRACLPGKKTVRLYRVESVTQDHSSNCADQLIILREMWRRSSDGVWDASKHAMQFSLSSLSRVTEVFQSLQR